MGQLAQSSFFYLTTYSLERPLSGRILEAVFVKIRELAQSRIQRNYFLTSSMLRLCCLENTSDEAIKRESMDVEAICRWQWPREIAEIAAATSTDGRSKP
jgi:hypothetical protein